MNPERKPKWGSLDVGKATKGRYYYEMLSEYRHLKNLVDAYSKAGQALPPRLKQQLPKLRELESYLSRQGFI